MPQPLKKLSWIVAICTTLGAIPCVAANVANEDQATFYPNLSINISGLYDQLDDPFNVGSDPAKDPFDYHYNLGIGFSGSLPAKALGPNLKLLYGGYFDFDKTTQPLAERFDDGYGNGVISQFSNKSLYIGIGSPMGNLKFGNLSTNSLGLSPDFWSTEGAAGLTIYRRTFFPVTNAILFESPNLNGWSFHLVNGIAKRVNGIYERYPENAPAVASVESVALYGGTVQYQKAGYFVKYSGLIRRNGLREPGATDKDEDDIKRHAYLHRLEGGYNQNNWFASVGYQYLLNNAGWGDTLYAIPKREQIKYVGPEVGVATGYKLPSYGLRYFAFPMHEIVASLSYTAGKFVPKASIAVGCGAKNIYESASVPGSHFELPGYVQGVMGVDYFATDHIIINLAYGQLNWLHVKGAGDNKKWLNQKTVALNLSYWY